MRGTKAKRLFKEALTIAVPQGYVKHVYKDLKAASKNKPAVGKFKEPRRRKSTQLGLDKFLVFSPVTGLYHWLSKGAIRLSAHLNGTKEWVQLHPSYNEKTVAEVLKGLK